MTRYRQSVMMEKRLEILLAYNVPCKRFLPVFDLPPAAGTGLPAREADGVPLALPTSLIFFLGPAPSDISPAVASPSLVEPAPALDRLAAFGTGVPERLPGAVAAVFLIFFRDDSLPLDSDKAGEPARFRDLLFFPSPCFFPCGVEEP